MRNVLLALAALHFMTTSAVAQGDRTAFQPLSLDQQNKISEIVTNRTPQPISHINFALQRDTVIRCNVTL